MTTTPETMTAKAEAVVAEAFTKSREPEYRIPDPDDRDDAEIAVNALREHGMLVEGDLTDYQHELVLNALDRLASQAILSAGATVLVPKDSAHIKAVRDAATGDAELVRSALSARITPTPDRGRCGGCRDLGPHRNVPGCDYYEPEPAPVTPRERLADRPCPHMPKVETRRAGECHRCAVESGWMIASTAPSPYEGLAHDEASRAELVAALRGARGEAESFREERDEARADLAEATAPSPDREKLIAKAKERVAEWSSTENLPSDVRLIHELLAALTVPPAPSPDRELLLTEANAAFDAAGRIPQGTMDHESQWLPFARLYNVTERLIDALAVPPVVNEAKLAEIIGEHVLDRYDTDTDLEVCACSVATEDHDAHVAAVLVERQHEWLGTGR